MRDAKAITSVIMQGPPGPFSLQNLDRFFVKNAEGNYDRVRWHQVGYSHLAYFDDEEQTWKAVPGREEALAAWIEEQTHGEKRNGAGAGCEDRVGRGGPEAEGKVTTEGFQQAR